MPSPPKGLAEAIPVRANRLVAAAERNGLAARRILSQWVEFCTRAEAAGLSLSGQCFRVFHDMADAGTSAYLAGDEMVGGSIPASLSPVPILLAAMRSSLIAATRPPYATRLWLSGALTGAGRLADHRRAQLRTLPGGLRSDRPRRPGRDLGADHDISRLCDRRLDPADGGSRPRPRQQRAVGRTGLRTTPERKPRRGQTTRKSGLSSLSGVSNSSLRHHDDETAALSSGVGAGVRRGEFREGIDCIDRWAEGAALCLIDQRLEIVSPLGGWACDRTAAAPAAGGQIAQPAGDGEVAPCGRSARPPHRRRCPSALAPS